MIGAGSDEPITQAIVNAGDSAIGDRVIGGAFCVVFLGALWVFFISLGLSEHPYLCTIASMFVAGTVAFALHRFINMVNRKRRHKLELEIQASREQETQRQLAEMRRKNEYV